MRPTDRLTHLGDCWLGWRGSSSAATAAARTYWWLGVIQNLADSYVLYLHDQQFIQTWKPTSAASWLQCPSQYRRFQCIYQGYENGKFVYSWTI